MSPTLLDLAVLHSRVHQEIMRLQAAMISPASALHSEEYLAVLAALEGCRNTLEGMIAPAADLFQDARLLLSPSLANS